MQSTYPYVELKVFQIHCSLNVYIILTWMLQVRHLFDSLYGTLFRVSLSLSFSPWSLFVFARLAECMGISVLGRFMSV